MFRRLATVPASLALMASLALPALAQSGNVSVSVNCKGKPETVKVTNNTPASLTIMSVASLFQERSNEPFSESQAVSPGSSYTYESGNTAPASQPYTLTRQYIFNDTASGEGVRVTTSDGNYTVLCSIGTKTFAVGQPSSSKGNTSNNPQPASQQPANNNQQSVPSSMPNNGAGGMAPGHAALRAALAI